MARNHLYFLNKIKTLIGLGVFATAIIFAAPSATAQDITTGLVGHWKLDEAAGPTIIDSAGTNNGTAVNTPTFLPAGGYLNGAIDLEASSNEYITVPPDASINNLGPFSVCSWINPESFVDYRAIVAKSDISDNGWNFYLNSSGAIGLHTRNYDNKEMLGGTISAWQHVCGTWDGTNGTSGINIYRNGVLLSSLHSQNTSGGTADDSGTPLSIGDDTGVFDSDGIFDDVRIYNRELSAADIATLYANCSSPIGYAGGITYNTTTNQMQYCDGTDWLAMGPAGDGGAGCSTPSGIAGNMIYNTTSDQMQYCEGDAWIAMGAPGDGGGGCSSPTGIAGDMTYNTTANFMQYCEGDAWISIGGTPINPCDNSPSPGDECSDGSVYAGVSPDGSVPMFTTHCDVGMTWNGSTCTGSRSPKTWNDGAFNFVTTSYTSTTTGASNTTNIAPLDSNSVAGGTQDHEAVVYCENLSQNGQTDWYLPALQELNVMRGNRVAIANFDTSGGSNGWYWSSSENNNDSAEAYRFSDAYQPNADKSDAIEVRCIRK